MSTGLDDSMLRYLLNGYFSVFLEEIPVGTGGVSKVDDPSQGGWVLSNPIRT